MACGGGKVYVGWDLTVDLLADELDFSGADNVQAGAP
jgi:hypothetical protein